MAYCYFRDFQDFEEEDLGQRHGQATGAQPWANDNYGINIPTGAGQDIRSGTGADTAPANDGGPSWGPEMFNGYPPSWAEIKELIPIPWNPMTIERYKTSARARLLDAAREDYKKEAALGSVSHSEEPTSDDIASITAQFEAPPLWKGKWMARAVRREIITSRRHRAGLPAFSLNRTANQAFVDVLDFVTPIEENYAPVPGITDNRLWAASHFFWAMGDLCFPAIQGLREDLRDAFINFAANYVKRQLNDELEEDRRLPIKPSETQPNEAQAIACLDRRFGPDSSRMLHRINYDIRRVKRDMVLGQRRYADYLLWARMLVYSGHRGPSPIENPTNSLFQTFVVNTAIEEYTKKVDGAQDGDDNGGEPAFAAGTWKANIELEIRHLVTVDNEGHDEGAWQEDILATIHSLMRMGGPLHM